MISEFYAETIYRMVVMLSCLLIYFKANRMYNLTSHKGIKYFKNTFMFFFIGYGLRYVYYFLSVSDVNIGVLSLVLFPLKIAYIYLIGMAGFSLVSSLLWADIDSKRMWLLHGIALGVGVYDTYYDSIFLYITQLLIISYALIITFSNYKESRLLGKRNFSQLYFLALVLAFIGYMFNLISKIIQLPKFGLLTYFVSTSVFLIFLYGVYRWPRKGKD